MAFFNILALLVLALLLTHVTKEKLVDVLPMAVCILILVLYVLAFFWGLALIDYLSILLLASSAFVFFACAKDKQKALLRRSKRVMLEPGTIIILGTIVLVSICVSAKLVTWWDDYNFWATDVKSLFYLNGFADKYCNVAAEFGDYPPGTQLLKWWFLHLQPGRFVEGLMFAGYYCLNLCFLAPLLRYFKGKNVVMMALCALGLWLFPSTVEIFYIDGCCADLTMAVIYGAYLVAVIDRKNHSSLFYYGRLACYLMVLVLTKNVAFMWVAFALLFTYGYTFLQRQELSGKKTAAKLAVLTILPVGVEVSWLLYCFLHKRVAKLTGTAISMATGSIQIPDYSKEMVHAFIEAFISWPLHRWKTIAIDISPLALFLLVMLTMVVMIKGKVVEKRRGWYLCGYLCISGIAFYAIDLLSHLTIFAIESQYLEPYGMISSIERYGAPFTIGSLYLIAYLIMEHVRRMEEDKIVPASWRRKKWGIFLSRYGGYLLCLAFVFLTADYSSAYRGLWGYRNTTEETLQSRIDIMDEQAVLFTERIEDYFAKPYANDCARVLYVRDSEDARWIQNTYLNFEASPISLAHAEIDGKTVTQEELLALIRNSHAGYLYIEKQSEELACLDECTVDDQFQTKRLYQIIEAAEGIRLIQVD